MAGLPRGLMWRSLDDVGAEHVLLDDRRGLHARGTVITARPVAFTTRYELSTDDAWATARFEVTVEGAGFLRTVRLERAAHRWRITASEQGDLDAQLRAAGQARAGFPGAENADLLDRAVDVDLSRSPLTNTLPIRRLRLLDAAPGTSYDVEVAWVLVPSLEVIHSRQSYVAMGGSAVRFRSGTFTAELDVDPDGYVRHYPGLAERA